MGNGLIRLLLLRTIFKIWLAIFGALLFFTIIFIPISFKLFNIMGYFSKTKTFEKNYLMSLNIATYKKIYLIIISILYALTIGWFLSFISFMSGLISYISIIMRENGSLFWSGIKLVFLPLFYNVKDISNFPIDRFLSR